METFKKGDIVLLRKPPNLVGKKLELNYDGLYVVSKPGLCGTTYICSRLGLPEKLVNNERLKNYLQYIRIHTDCQSSIFVIQRKTSQRKYQFCDIETIKKVIDSKKLTFRLKKVRAHSGILNS